MSVVKEEIFNDLLSDLWGSDTTRKAGGRLIVFRMVEKMTKDFGKQVYVSCDNRSDRA
ncbi:MAG: hypothetical protein OXH34_05375 [Bacteroidetes bacterium]|nr:hypothetical protein [Bacteroidota bacterium]MCY3593997.1 hypothetical protein [Bacteroidota bacterium]